MKKKAEYPAFSNGTEFSLWEARNCDECIKSSRYNPKTDTYTKYRCAAQREIHEAYMDDGRTSQRVYDICQQEVCPYKKTERKYYPRRKRLPPGPDLFDQ